MPPHPVKIPNPRKLKVSQSFSFLYRLGDRAGGRYEDGPEKACLVNWISILNCCFLAFLEVRNSIQIGFQCYHGNTRHIQGIEPVQDFNFRLGIQTKV